VPDGRHRSGKDRIEATLLGLRFVFF
jgi:hypothetical protein